MASYAFTGNPWVIGTSKPHILLAARSGNPFTGNPGAIGSSSPKPHLLAARAGAIGSSSPKPHILLAAGAIGNSTRMAHILLPVRAGNPEAIDSSTPEPQPQSFEFSEEDIASEENLWDLYERWRSYHNVSRSPDEMRKRINVFKQNAITVIETNKLNLSFTVGLNIFGDMSHEEFVSTRMGLAVDDDDDDDDDE